MERKFDSPTMKIVSVIWDQVASQKHMDWSTRSLPEGKIIKEVQKKNFLGEKFDPESIRRYLDVLVDEKCADVTAGNDGRKFTLGKSQI